MIIKQKAENKPTIFFLLVSQCSWEWESYISMCVRCPDLLRNITQMHLRVLNAYLSTLENVEWCNIISNDVK